MMLLAGCTEIKEPITADSEGFWNSYIVYPLSALIIWLSEAFGENYGLGIIGVTLNHSLSITSINDQTGEKLESNAGHSA